MQLYYYLIINFTGQIVPYNNDDTIKMNTGQRNINIKLVMTSNIQMDVIKPQGLSLAKVDTELNIAY